MELDRRLRGFHPRTGRGQEIGRLLVEEPFDLVLTRELGLEERIIAIVEELASLPDPPLAVGASAKA